MIYEFMDNFNRLCWYTILGNPLMGAVYSTNECKG